MSEEDHRTIGGAPITAGVMIKALKEICGAAWLEGCEERARQEMAKRGVLGWQMLDTNVLLDVVPMPQPWVGQWGYRLKCAHIERGGDVHVAEFYLPQCELPSWKHRSNN